MIDPNFVTIKDNGDIVVDAAGQKLGRICTHTATYLRDKHLPTYAPNVGGRTLVKIVNASKLDISDKKMTEVYDRYSGYPGGRKEETRGHLIERRGYSPVIMHAVRGMIPSNRLRNGMLKHLTIEG